MSAALRLTVYRLQGMMTHCTTLALYDVRIEYNRLIGRNGWFRARHLCWPDHRLDRGAESLHVPPRVGVHLLAVLEEIEGGRALRGGRAGHMHQSRAEVKT